MEVLVLGADGMLGSQMVGILNSNGIESVATERVNENSTNLRYEFGTDDLSKIISKFPNLKYVINCIGAIPQRISNSKGFRVNSELPLILEALSVNYGLKVIQIATDCVFDGLKGGYSENDLTNARDSYGISKALGEIVGPNFMHLRCSIIGRDKGSRSLYSWLLSHEKSSVVLGYTNHSWNGVTTLAFSRIVSGIISRGHFLPGTHHVVPLTSVTKYQLLKLIADAENRPDLLIIPHETNQKVNRTLSTINQPLNLSLWNDGGYSRIPSIEELVVEFSSLSKERENGYE